MRVGATYRLPLADYPTAHDALEEARQRRPAHYGRWVELAPGGKYWTVSELEDE